MERVIDFGVPMFAGQNPAVDPLAELEVGGNLEERLEDGAEALDVGGVAMRGGKEERDLRAHEMIVQRSQRNVNGIKLWFWREITGGKTTGVTSGTDRWRWRNQGLKPGGFARRSGTTKLVP